MSHTNPVNLRLPAALYQPVLAQATRSHNGNLSDAMRYLLTLGISVNALLLRDEQARQNPNRWVPAYNPVDPNLSNGPDSVMYEALELTQD